MKLLCFDNSFGAEPPQPFWINPRFVLYISSLGEGFVELAMSNGKSVRVRGDVDSVAQRINEVIE